MQESTIVAVYKTPEVAAAAVKELEAQKVPAAAISRHSKAGTYRGETRTAPEEDKGFWASIFGSDNHVDHSHYQKQVEGGKTVVTVRTTNDTEAHITSILERHDPIDLDTEAAAAPAQTGQAPLGATAARPAAAAQDERNLSMKLHEERLEVGKKQVTDGTTRVRRYVTEAPVQKNVSLHSENVTLERRPVKDGEIVGNPDFTEKSFQMTESHEEAVVAKNAHVVEEVRLRKEGSDRDHTVKDTVRKHEVEIEHADGTKVAAPADRKPAVPADRKV